MQRAGEQQESEQHVEHQIAHVDLLQEVAQGTDGAGGGDGAEHQEQKRGDQGDTHHADGLRQAQHAVVEVTEQRRQGYE